MPGNDCGTSAGSSGGDSAAAQASPTGGRWNDGMDLAVRARTFTEAGLAAAGLR